MFNELGVAKHQHQQHRCCTYSAGTHTLTIGGFNNKKTYFDESTEIRIDDVVVETVSTGTTSGQVGRP
jgi:hypothetical protein